MVLHKIDLDIIVVDGFCVAPIFIVGYKFNIFELASIKLSPSLKYGNKGMKVRLEHLVISIIFPLPSLQISPKRDDLSVGGAIKLLDNPKPKNFLIALYLWPWLIREKKLLPKD